ncbi:MAG: Mur ligase family protein, partial [Saprospiraceae bacterium]
MRIHLIAIGGSVMHNIALALQKNGHIVSGSDDEIYNPAKERLAKAALLPDVMGWNENNITPEIDLVILGMHARSDNPELLKAQVLQLRVVSYPEFIYQHAKDKLRIAVAGSHGKTTTTAMIIHILKENNISFDYLVGAQLDGFNNMVRFSDAPIMVIEADEYLASPIDTVPKMNHYHPQISVITGIAWDHINVFPTFENYVEQFSVFVKNLSKTDTLY